MKPAWRCRPIWSVGILLYSLAGFGGAREFRWSFPISGAFSDKENWTSFPYDDFPAAGDLAIFNAGNGYTVTCDGAASGTAETGGHVTFQLDGDYSAGEFRKGAGRVVLRGGGSLIGGPFYLSGSGSDDENHLEVDGSGLTMTGLITDSAYRIIGRNSARILSSGLTGQNGTKPLLETGAEWRHTGLLSGSLCIVNSGALLAADEINFPRAEMDAGRLQAGILVLGGLQAKSGAGLNATTADFTGFRPVLLEGGGTRLTVSGVLDGSTEDTQATAGAVISAGSLSSTGNSFYIVDGNGSQLAVASSISQAVITLRNQGQGNADTVNRSSLTVRDPGSLFAFAGMAEDSTLNILNGGRVNGALFRGPMTASRTAGVAVTGTGSALVLSGNLELGAFGQGALNIAEGGQVDCHKGFLDGGESGVTSTSSVFGTGSFWMNRTGLAVGLDRGVATLNIGGGGRVEVHGAQLGVALGTNSQAVIDVDGGSLPTPSALDASQVGETGIGAIGKGKLSIRAKGRVLTRKLSLGAISGAEGTVEVIGAGTSLEASGTLEIGQQGQGLMTIFAGGLATAPDVIVGSSSGNNRLRLTGTGSTMNISRSLHIGETGQGQLSLEAGTKVVMTGPPDTALVSVGQTPGSVGTLSVNGTGASFSGAEALMIVGLYGQGTLNITGGGDVNLRGIGIGGGPGASGVATVSGAGSVLRSPDLIHIGGSGSRNTGPGEVTASAGGLVQCRFNFRVYKPGILRLTGGSAIVGQTSEAPIPGTVLIANTGKFHLGGRLIGSVVVRPGGNFLPGSSPGKATIEGDLTMDTGTALEFEIGAPGAGTGYDQIDATGSITLGGRLDVVFRDGFAPANGQSFELVKGTVIPGDIPAVSVKGLAPGFTYTLTKPGGNLLLLTATSAGVADSLPELTLDRQTDGSILIFWPEYITGWTLQQSSGLSGPWQTVETTGNTLTVSAPAGRAFYRLAKF